MNYGNLLLQALLKHWWRLHADDENEGSSNDGNGPVHIRGGKTFSVPSHTPVIFRYAVIIETAVLFTQSPMIKMGFCFSEVGGRTLYRLLVKDAAGETEGVLLTETVPSWVVNIVVDNKNLPPFIKIPFYLLPHATSGIKSLKK